MLVWGSKVGITDLGPQGSKHCPTCEKERSFRLMLRYKVSHLWYVIKWVSEKRYGVACEVCNRGDDLVTQAVEAKLGKPQIPTTHSRAWIAVVAAIACLLVIGLWDRPERVERMNSLLASPQKSDLYVVNLASFGLFCSSCTGLPSNAFAGSQSYSAGNLFGAGTGAFNDTASGSWELELTLAPFSDADFYATLASDVTMAAQARAVPEPQSWMMMVFGAGAVGYGTRRRRRLALA